MRRSITIIKELLERMDIRSTYDEETDVLGFDMGIRETPVHVIVITQHNLLSVRAFLPFMIPSKRRKDAMEFVTRANYWIRNGAFGIDLEKGRLAFSVATPFSEETVIAEELEELLNSEMRCVVHYMEHAMEPLLKLTHGSVRAKHAVALFDESRRGTEDGLKTPEALLDGQAIAVN